LNFEEIRTHTLPEQDQSKAKRKYVKKTPKQKAIETQRVKRPYKKRSKSTQKEGQTTDSKAGIIVLTDQTRRRYSPSCLYEYEKGMNKK
jgi:hypothetical protein